MKRILCLLLTVVMMIGVLAACGTKETIIIWSFTDEIPNAVLRYKEMNPEFPYDFDITVMPTNEGVYQAALDQALTGGDLKPDIFMAESSFVLKYTQGDASAWALPYEDLDIDVSERFREADIAPYIGHVGTRPSDGKIVALAYQNTGGVLIYRRSIAKDTWGTDDPAVIATKVGPGWDKYLEAAAELAEKGYSVASGASDIWHVIRETASSPWVVDDKLNIAPEREAFLDIAKALYDSGYTNHNDAWNEEWEADMSGSGPRPVFGFLGPAWFINYTMIDSVGDTFGDWAITLPPVNFSWGGTWVICNSQGNPDVRDGVRELIEWITLDTSETGFQYLFANGNLFEGSNVFSEQAAAYAAGNFAKDAVGSSVVMDKSDGSLMLLGGQNMYDYLIPAGAGTKGDHWFQYDETINRLFLDEALQYAKGMKTREEALSDFKENVSTGLQIHD